MTKMTVVVAVDKEILHHEILYKGVIFSLEIARNIVLHYGGHLIWFGGFHQLKNQFVFNFFEWSLFFQKINYVFHLLNIIFWTLDSLQNGTHKSNQIWRVLNNSIFGIRTLDKLLVLKLILSNCVKNIIIAHNFIIRQRFRKHRSFQNGKQNLFGLFSWKLIII